LMCQILPFMKRLNDDLDDVFELKHLGFEHPSGFALCGAVGNIQERLRR